MFKDIIDTINREETQAKIYTMTSTDVEQALTKERLTVDDFMALLSPAAQAYLEPMAQLSRRYTMERFGKTIQFFIPLYMTNSCTNQCVYCGFNAGNEIQRIVLNEQQILEEAESIKKMGNFQNIILLTGENPKVADVSYIEKAIRIVKPYFSTVNVEVQPLDSD
ncbi:MAG: 2-iminoacetate synthase ThiH, partial [Bacteroidales bacterium]|nr:2-iminoacetate synthase ThiH [Bacteroidales bacterium]